MDFTFLGLDEIELLKLLMQLEKKQNPKESSISHKTDTVDILKDGNLFGVMQLGKEICSTLW